MLTLEAPQAETLWDEVLPIEARVLPEDQAKLDRPGVRSRAPARRSPSYLRLMVIKALRRALIATLALAGLRIDEALGLRWRHVVSL